MFSGQTFQPQTQTQPQTFFQAQPQPQGLFQNPQQQAQGQIPLQMGNLKALTNQNQETELQIVFNNFLNAIR